MLDVPSITFLSNYLQGYPSTVLVVSHDRAFLNEVATDIVHQHSERLDYYRGANFGVLPVILFYLKVTKYCDRFLLRDKRRAKEGCEAGVREPNGTESASTRSVDHEGWEGLQLKYMQRSLTNSVIMRPSRPRRNRESKNFRKCLYSKPLRASTLSISDFPTWKSSLRLSFK